jgi:acyl-CoA thioesterase FadM
MVIDEPLRGFVPVLTHGVAGNQESQQSNWQKLLHSFPRIVTQVRLGSKRTLALLVSPGRAREDCVASLRQSAASAGTAGAVASKRYTRGVTAEVNMRLRLRLLWVLLRSLWCAPLRVLDESVVPFTVLPNDVDVSKLTDDRYLAIADLGRLDLALRNGLGPALLRNRWAPMATVAAIRFRHPLRLFQRYCLHTKVLWWDDKTFYIRQVFERAGRTQATAYVCATFLGQHGPIAPATLLAQVGQVAQPPAITGLVPQLEEFASLLRAEQVEDERGRTALPRVD